MPYRQTVFAVGEIYHVFNRSIIGSPVFSSFYEYSRFLGLLDFYHFLNTPLSFSHYSRLEKQERKKLFEDLRKQNLLNIEILAFCLMSNHFHLLVKQIADNGIKTVLSNIQNSYAKYFNTKHERFGPLFQPMFKAVRIENEEQLVHTSRYIHLNPTTSFLTKVEDLSSYQWSSLPYYLGQSSSKFVNKELIINLIGDFKKYQQFILDQAEYQQKLHLIQHLLLEYP